MHLLLHIMSQLIPYELKKATTEETKEMHEGITDLYLHECRFSENPFSSNVQLNVTKPTSDSFLESRTFCSSKCQAFPSIRTSANTYYCTVQSYYVT